MRTTSVTPVGTSRKPRARGISTRRRPPSAFWPSRWGRRVAGPTLFSLSAST
ncbi:MAG: hypothetical protein MZU84_08095 [Sphingobacterium sp.]|nr:hypothetical protein [Sphingobacterium sp.]